MSEGKQTLDGQRVQLSNNCRKCILSRVKSIDFNINVDGFLISEKNLPRNQKNLMNEFAKKALSPFSRQKGFLVWGTRFSARPKSCL